tara:strand:- start:322 stop:1152 length:831 start_codon:yes stop_codon:yes gene_type:complete
MNWKIFNVSIPVKDLEKSKIFYNDILGNNTVDTEFYKNFFSDDNEDIFLGSNGFGVRLFKPKHDLELNDNIQSRRSYVSIIISDFESVLKKLQQSNFRFIYKKINSFETVILQEPSLNMMQFIKSNEVLDKYSNYFFENSNFYIHHMNLESLDVRESVHFISELIGLKEGNWVAPNDKGDFSIDKKELSLFPISNDNKGLHFIKPDEGFAFRNNFIHNPSIGGHPAFTVKNINLIKEKLDNLNILYSDANVYAMPGFHQIYLYDANANTLEINQEV